MKACLIVFLALFLSSLIFKVSAENDKCMFTRPDGTEIELTRERYAIEIPLLLDMDMDNRVSVEEVKKGIDTHLTGMEKWIFKLFATPEYVMKTCDVDHDGYIDMHDFFKSKDTCFKDCEYWTEIENILEKQRQTQGAGSLLVANMRRREIQARFEQVKSIYE